MEKLDAACVLNSLTLKDLSFLSSCFISSLSAAEFNLYCMIRSLVLCFLILKIQNRNAGFYAFLFCIFSAFPFLFLRSWINSHLSSRTLISFLYLNSDGIPSAEFSEVIVLLSIQVLFSCSIPISEITPDIYLFLLSAVL